MNTKKQAFETIANLYRRRNEGGRGALPEEQLQEWDGKIDGVKLIREMASIRDEVNRQAPKGHHSLKVGSNSFKTQGQEQPRQDQQKGQYNTGGAYYVQVNPQALSSSKPLPPPYQPPGYPYPQYQGQFPPQFVPNVAASIGLPPQNSSNPQYGSQYLPKPSSSAQQPKFDMNPKHKLKPSQKNSSEYVRKAKQEDEESEYVKKETKPKEALKPVDAGDLEKMMSGAKPSPTSIEEIEKQMMKK